MFLSDVLKVFEKNFKKLEEQVFDKAKNCKIFVQ